MIRYYLFIDLYYYEGRLLVITLDSLAVETFLLIKKKKLVSYAVE